MQQIGTIDVDGIRATVVWVPYDAGDLAERDLPANAGRLLVYFRPEEAPEDPELGPMPLSEAPSWAAEAFSSSTWDWTPVGNDNE